MDTSCSKVINISHLCKESTECAYKVDIITNNHNLLYQTETLSLILTELKLRSLILDEIAIYAFCILPEKISLVISMKEECKLDQWVKKFKAYITRNSHTKKLWKPKFEMEEIESSMLSYKCTEVVKQPETLGLVNNWNDYSLSFKA